MSSFDPKFCRSWNKIFLLSFLPLALQERRLGSWATLGRETRGVRTWRFRHRLQRDLLGQKRWLAHGMCYQDHPGRRYHRTKERVSYGGPQDEVSFLPCFVFPWVFFPDELQFRGSRVLFHELKLWLYFTLAFEQDSKVAICKHF